jgi:ABC-2 type transport system ATP-binding protein
MEAIKVTNLTKIYAKSHLGKVTRSLGVENLSLDIHQGEIFGLLGLNGSGKTTTIKLLLGLLRPNSGSISILGKTLPDTAVLSCIGYLPEVPYFYRYLTALEIIEFYGQLSGIQDVRKRSTEVLEIVGLSSVANKKLAEFSKGMLQRIGLAQSLLHDPQILIYDEPVSGLDPLAMQEMRELLLKLKERGKTIFLSSHLISEVERICDRVAILVKGKLVRTMEQREWNTTDGELERIFVSDAAGSSTMGRIKL